MLEYFLPFVITIGLIVSYRDKKEGRIPNFYILILLILGLIFQILSNPNLIPLLMLLSYTFAISFLLWFLGIWPAGDAKLFFSLFLFFPSNLLNSSLILDYLVNIFVPIFFFFLVSKHQCRFLHVYIVYIDIRQLLQFKPHGKSFI